MGVAGMVHVASVANLLPSPIMEQFSHVSNKIKLFLVRGLLFGNIGGPIVAAILKRLDNVVKEYSSDIFYTQIPHHHSFNIHFIIFEFGFIINYT